MDQKLSLSGIDDSDFYRAQCGAALPWKSQPHFSILPGNVIFNNSLE